MTSKWLMALVWAFCGLSINATPTLTLTDVSAKQGETAPFAINLDSDTAIKGFQCQLMMPSDASGIKLADNEDGSPDLQLDVIGTDHQLTFKYDQTSKSYTIVVFSPSGQSLPNSADILKGSLILNASPNSYFYQITNAKVVPVGSNDEITGSTSSATIFVFESDPEPEAPSGPVITVTPANKTLKIGETLQLTCQLREDYAGQTVIWRSSHPEIASVDDNGLVTALAITPGSTFNNGVANIYAYCGNEKAKCTIEVYRKSQEIEWPEDLPNMVVGKTLQLNATATSGLEVSYSIVSGSNICSLEGNQLTLNGTGTIKIKASQSGDETYRSATAVTKSFYCYNIKLNNEKVTVTNGETKELSLTVSPASATEMGVKWSSSDTNIVDVDDSGNINAKSIGEATITVKCGDAIAQCTVTVTPVYCTEITLNQTAYTMRIGETFQLVADVLPYNTADKTIVWSSANEDVAIVDQNGLVTGVGTNGGYNSVRIYATCGSKEAKCTFTIKKKEQEITWAEQPQTASVGDIIELHANASSGLPVTYSILKGSKICTLQDNKVEITGAGEIKITASQAGDSEYLKATECILVINAKERMIESIEISPAQLNLKKGDAAEVVATVSPSDASEAYKLASSDQSIVTIDANGAINAVGIGEAEVYAVSASGDAKAACKIIVGAPDATSIAISVSTIEIQRGQTFALTANLVPVDAVGDIVWQTSDSGIANVDANGCITAVAVGHATISATCGALKQNCDVTVVPVGTESVQITNAPTKMYVNDSYKLIAIVMPEDADDQSVSWKSDNESVLTVDADGTVTAIATGYARITATGSNGKEAKCRIDVYKNTQQIVWEQDLDGLVVGDEVELTAYSTANLPLGYSPTKGNCWEISGNVLKITAKGIVSITAKNAGNDQYKPTDPVTRTFETNDLLASSISFDKSQISMLQGETTTLAAEILPAGVSEGLEWTSSDLSVATVSSGIVKAVGVGTAVIELSGTMAHATCVINVEPVLAESLTLSRNDFSLVIDQTVQLRASISPENVTDPIVLWSSADANIADIDENGLVAGISVGTTTITAKCGEASASCSVTVLPVECTSLSISDSEATLYVDEQLALFPMQILPENTTYKTLTWTTSDPEVAIVDKDGVVTAIGSGSARIKAECGQGSAKCTVTVKKKLQEIIWDQEIEDVCVTQSVELNAYASSELPVTYQLVSGSAICTLDNGVVTLNGKGRVKISANQGGNEKFRSAAAVTKEFYVGDLLAEALTIEPEQISLRIGQSSVLTTQALPAAATEQIYWESANPQIATVDSDGQVTAISLGETQIKAYGVNCQAICTITVLPVEATGVSISNTQLSIQLGQKHKFAASVTPKNTTFPQISWSSSDESVASVDAEGWLEALAIGEAIITAKCGEAYAQCLVSVEPIKANSVTLDITSQIMRYGDSLQLSATVSPDETTFPTIEWISNNEDVAVVDDNGLVEAVGIGVARIRAVCGDVHATCTIEVYKANQTIEWNQDFSNVKVGDVITLTAEATSGLEISYEITKGSAIAKLNGDKLKLSGVGTVKVKAKQGGDDFYKAATSIISEFVVKETSSIADVDADALSISIQGNDVIVSGIPSTDIIAIYALDGRLIYLGIDKRVSLAVGPYILTHKNASYRIYIK